jgi:O-antigen ligase
MITLKKIYYLLFLVGWFYFPFNDFEGIPALGEFKNEAGAFFFMAGFLVLLVDSVLKGKISIPYKSKIFQILLLFFIWCIITIILNFYPVSQSYFKHTSGFNRFVRQYISLSLSALIFFIFYWNVVKDLVTHDILYKIRKVLLISLLFVFVYGFLETLIVYFGLNFIRPILQIFDYFPFLDVNYPPGNRISSVAYESPSLGNYLITVSGWMFSFILTSKNKYRFIPTLMVLFLTFFSGSRAALIIITIQLVILISVLVSMQEYRKIVFNVFKYTFILSVIFLVINGPKIVKDLDKRMESLNFSKNLTKSISNQSRFGMQYASLQVFKEHPVIGVGFGQETYYKRFYYPAWAKKNNWEFKVMYENKNFKSFPTAYNLYTRLLAETGIIGIIILITLIYLCISKSKILWKNGIDEEKTMGLILLISFTGLSLNWLQTDFFRQHGFWLCMAILINILNDFRFNTRNKEISENI